jgi:alpha-1,3-glucosyltransferase
VLSLGFKQMALYYAPAIGSYLLARCLFLGIPGPGYVLLYRHNDPAKCFGVESFKHFTRLAIITVSSFMVLFLPFYLPPFAPSFRHILNPVSRIFPFNRGLFEDKVANFWCASNVVLKWRERVSRSMLVRFSAGLTALGFLPSVGVMLNSGWRMRLSTISSTEQEEQENQMPFLPLLPYVLLASSFSFFLFSFQVREKTILVPLLPMTLLLSGAPVDSSVYAWGVLVNNIGVFRYVDAGY